MKQIIMERVTQGAKGSIFALAGVVFGSIIATLTTLLIMGEIPNVSSKTIEKCLSSEIRAHE